MKTVTLLEAFGGFNGDFLSWWDQEGIVTDIPWKPEQPQNRYELFLKAVPSSTLDRLLFQEYGDRPISRWVESVLGDDNRVPELQAKTLAAKILQLFYVSWARLFEDYSSEYNPVENYSMEEGGTDDINKKGANATVTGTADATLTNSTGETDASAAIGTLTDYEVKSKPAEGTTTHRVAPYDSTTLNEVSSDTYALGAGADSPAYSKEKGKRGAANNYEDNETRKHSFTRHGNIGVLTATQMITADVEFWSSNDFFSKIVEDVASIVTIPIYE